MISFRSVFLIIILSGLVSACSSGTKGAGSPDPITTTASQPAQESSTPSPKPSVSPTLAVRDVDYALIRKNPSESLVHLEWKPYGPDVTLPLEFGKDKAELIFGLDHPNGTKIHVYFPEDSFAWQLDMSIYDGSSVFENSGELEENYVLQGAQYDFDNDGIAELIIAAGDGLINLNVWVFSYTHVENVKKINPFRMELATYGQSNIYLDKNEIIFPYGSQGLYDSYKYVDKEFLKPIN